MSLHIKFQLPVMFFMYTCDLFSQLKIKLMLDVTKSLKHGSLNNFLYKMSGEANYY